MFKKIVSFLLCISMSMITTSAWAFTDVTDNASIDFVAGIGLMQGNDDGEFLPDGFLSRAEAAKIISNIYLYGDPEAAVSFDFFGNDVETLLVPDSGNSASNAYTDVTKSHQYYDDILIASGYGVMVGTSENTFDPERNLKVQEAVKLVVDLLGYKPMAISGGGYPSGYLAAARSLGLKFSGDVENDITRGEFAALLAYAIEKVDIVMTEYNTGNMGYNISEGNTVLNYIMNVNKITGIITENGVTSLTGESSIGETEIKISANDGEYVLYFDDKTSYTSGLIGRRVDCYYFNDDTDEAGKIVYCRANNKNKEMTINLKDIENSDSFDGKVLEYQNGSNRVQRANIIDGAYYIINGKAVSNIPADIFDYDNGYVNLISTGSYSGYDLVVIDAYENWVINSIDKEEGYIYNKNAGARKDGNDKFILIEEDTNCIITDINGNVIKYTDLEAGMALDVARSLDGTVIRAIAVKKTVSEFKITSIDKSENTISDGTTEYTVSKAFENADSMQPYKNGGSYILTINSFGDVVWIDAGLNTWRMGYMHSVKYLEEEDYVAAKILVADKNFILYKVAKKVKYSSIKGESATRVDAVFAANDIGSYKGVIRYKLNAEDEITEIEMPLEQGAENKSKDRLYVIAKGTPEETDYMYSDQFRTFGCKVFINDSTTRILSIPHDLTEYDKYVFADSSSFSSGSSYDFTAYGTNYLNPEAEMITTSVNARTVLSDMTPPKIVTDIITTIDDNDSVVTELTVADLSGNLTTVYDSSDNDYIHKALARTADQDNIKPRDYYTVEKGDIIRYTKDSNGYLNFVEMIFDANGEYNNSIYADTLPDVDTEFKHTKKGILAGTVGYFSDTISNTNPLGNAIVQSVTSNSVKSYTAGSPRIFLGYVYSVFGNYVTYTNKDLYSGSVGMDEGRYLVETRGLNNVGDTAVVELDGKNVKVRSGGIADVKSYLDYPNDFSRIIVISAYTDRRSCIIINGSMK